MHTVLYTIYCNIIIKSALFQPLLAASDFKREMSFGASSRLAPLALVSIQSRAYTCFQESIFFLPKSWICFPLSHRKISHWTPAIDSDRTKRGNRVVNAVIVVVVVVIAITFVPTVVVDSCAFSQWLCVFLFSSPFLHFIQDFEKLEGVYDWKICD